MVTINTIAKNLGLNKTTVSKALNNASDINSETRSRVLNEAQRIGYVRRARKSRSKSHVIGIIVPDVKSPYYNALITVLTRQLEAKGYSVLLTISYYNSTREIELITHLSSLNVDGIMLIIDQTGEKLMQFQSLVPTVIIGLDAHFVNYDVVSVDERRGMNAVVEHLLAQGRRRISFIGGPGVVRRLDYLRECLQAHGVTLSSEYVALSPTKSEECGYECMKKLLSLPLQPDAVVAGYDRIALGVYRILSEKKIRIPEDIAVVGFDDSFFCEYLPISLTSVRYDVDTICRVTTAILLDRISSQKEQAVQAVAIAPRLIIRESSAVCESENQEM